MFRLTTIYFVILLTKIINRSLFILELIRPNNITYKFRHLNKHRLRTLDIQTNFTLISDIHTIINNIKLYINLRCKFYILFLVFEEELTYIEDHPCQNE